MVIIIPLGLLYLNMKIDENTNHIEKNLIENRFPKHFEIEEEARQAIYLNIKDNAEYDEHFNIFSAGKFIVCIYMKKTSADDHDIILLVAENKEVENQSEYLNNFKRRLDEYFNLSKSSRILKFDHFAKGFFLDKVAGKLLFLGFPGSGKTCIKKVFFDGSEPMTLLNNNNNPEPTIGTEYHLYSWLNTELSVLDTSGQELETYLSKNSQESDIFLSADSIVYIFDVLNWQQSEQEVIENLKKLINVTKNNSTFASIHAFCHKIDLIALNHEKRASIYSAIRNKLQDEFNIGVFFTSLYPKFTYSLFRSLQLILNDLSKIGMALEDEISHLISGLERSALVLLDKNFRIIADEHTPDLSLDIIDGSIKLIKAMNELIVKSENDEILNKCSFSSTSQFHFMIKKIPNKNLTIKFIVVLSLGSDDETIKEIGLVLESKLLTRSCLSDQT